MTAGYSGKPLIEKLGIKPGLTVAFVDVPDDYATLIGDLPMDVTETDLHHGHIDFIHFFATTRQALEARFPELKAALKSNGSLWISWPKATAKGSARLPSDLGDNVVREIGLANGLVDVKVAAIDATWSGMKFVYRIVDRPKK
jgi:hypothetical protein